MKANSDVAEIEGAINRIAAYSQLYKPVINIKTAKEILKDIL